MVTTTVGHHILSMRRPDVWITQPTSVQVSLQCLACVIHNMVGLDEEWEWQEHIAKCINDTHAGNGNTGSGNGNNNGNGNSCAKTVGPPF